MDRREVKYHLAGWILFILCACFFIASSIKNQDTLALIGSMLFLIACLIFIVPLIWPEKKTENESREDKGL